MVGHGARVRGRGAGAHRWKPAELSKQAIALHDVPTDQQQHMRSQHSTAVAARWRRGGGGGGGGGRTVAVAWLPSLPGFGGLAGNATATTSKVKLGQRNYETTSEETTVDWKRKKTKRNKEDLSFVLCASIST